jgi:O-methyltransferase
MRLFKRPKVWAPDFLADNVGLRHKNLGVLQDPAFKVAWDRAAAGHGSIAPDIRLRAHTAVWAAKHALHLEGDFVECGVWTGLLSVTICHALNFSSIPRQFFLFDSFEGIPERDVEQDEIARIQRKNVKYTGQYERARNNFREFPNARLIKGYLPETLSQAQIGKIAYLSMDLNHAPSEMATIAELWAKITTGAVILLDDYAHSGSYRQYDAWNAFAEAKSVSILTCPTGQGIIVKPPD